MLLLFQKLKNNWIVSIVWIVVIAFLSLIPSKSVPKEVGSFDLLIHFTMYSTMGFLLYFSMFDKIKYRYQLVLLFLTLAGLGILFEILQKILPIGRSFSYSDIIFNSLGAGVVFIVHYLVKKKSF